MYLLLLDRKECIRGLIMKKCFVLILMSIFILTLTACSKSDKYEIEITVPAGSQEAFVYSEEEIMATGNQIIIYS